MSSTLLNGVWPFLFILVVISGFFKRSTSSNGNLWFGILIPMNSEPYVTRSDNLTTPFYKTLSANFVRGAEGERQHTCD